jgi:hypothetical protein
MQLKLADYGKNKGKFERFLKIGESFGYFGNYLIILNGQFLGVNNLKIGKNDNKF